MPEVRFTAEPLRVPKNKQPSNGSPPQRRGTSRAARAPRRLFVERQAQRRAVEFSLSSRGSVGPRQDTDSAM